MFSDLVGSTALSARLDPGDLREIISAYQKCVAETVQRFGVPTLEPRAVPTTVVAWQSRRPGAVASALRSPVVAVLPQIDELAMAPQQVADLTQPCDLTAGAADQLA
jgi:hypothetical protein